MPFALPFVRRRTRARRASDYERDLLAAVLESTDVAILACDRDGRVTRASRGAGELMGAACGVGSGPEVRIDQLQPRTPEGLPLAVADLPLMRALEGAVAPAFDVLVQARRGELLLRVSARPIQDRRAREVLGAVAVLADVTATRPRPPGATTHGPCKS